jgi:hypothetical protein
MKTMTLSEFARHLGCSPANITRLKKAGRLVLTDDGKVDVDGSLWRLAETQGGQTSQADLAPPKATAWKHPDHDYQFQRARREHFMALMKEREVREMLAKLVDVGELHEAVGEVIDVMRSIALAFPETVAAKIASTSDECQIREILEDGVQDLLLRIANQFDEMAAHPRKALP